MAPDPDAALMLAFQRGDERAFRTLFDRHARAMVTFCHHFVRDAARAEELAQDVFLNLHRAADRYRPTARFRTYLYRIASHHCLNELRRPERRTTRAEAPGEDAGGPAAPLDPDQLAGPAADPEATAVAAALGREVQALLRRLPEKQRAALVLARLEGLSYEEVAEVLETTVPAVKSLVHRATVAAAAALAPYVPGQQEVAS